MTPSTTISSPNVTAISTPLTTTSLNLPRNKLTCRRPLIPWHPSETRRSNRDRIKWLPEKIYRLWLMRTLKPELKKMQSSKRRVKNFSMWVASLVKLEDTSLITWDHHSSSLKLLDSLLKLWLKLVLTWPLVHPRSTKWNTLNHTERPSNFWLPLPPEFNLNPTKKLLRNSSPSLISCKINLMPHSTSKERLKTKDLMLSISTCHSWMVIWINTILQSLTSMLKYLPTMTDLNNLQTPSTTSPKEYLIRLNKEMTETTNVRKPVTIIKIPDQLEMVIDPLYLPLLDYSMPTLEI